MLERRALSLLRFDLRKRSVHRAFNAALGGSALFLDLRLHGVVLRGESAAVISRDLGRILLVSLTVMVLSGIGLLSE